MNKWDEKEIDKRIAAAFRAVSEHFKKPNHHTVTDAMEIIANQIDPPAKAEVRLNPCAKCGEPAQKVSAGGFNCSANCNRYEATVTNWNAANPVQPVAEEKRHKPGQKFLRRGGDTYRSFMRHDGTVGIISGEHVEQNGYSCRIVDGSFTTKDLFGSYAKNWQPID